MDGVVSGVAFAPYLPFVLLAAIFLAVEYAVVVAAVGAFLADALFLGPPGELLETPSDVFGFCTYAAAAVLIIGAIGLAKSLLHEPSRLGDPAVAAPGIFFSANHGKAWANWQGSATPMCLGPKDEVAEMMRAYIAQFEVGERLEALAKTRSDDSGQGLPLHALAGHLATAAGQVDRALAPSGRATKVGLIGPPQGKTGISD